MEIATFIETGKRGGDMERLGDTEWCRDAEQTVLQACVVDKNWETCLGGEGSQPQTIQPRVPVPGRKSP